MVPEVAVLRSPQFAPKPDVVKRERVFGMTETWAAGLAMGVIIALRVVYALHYRVDSDEPQHLHVVWGWAHGLLQYRDIFDNHSPLFQMLCAPLFWALGEHAWIVTPMRLAMLPLYAADLWLVYLIGRSLYVQRWGLWTAVVAACMPGFFLVTTEFRTDDLWTTVWLVAVWLAVEGALEGRRAFLFGLTLGACFSVSMKTTLLLVAMVVAGLGVMVLHGLSRRNTGVKAMAKRIGLILAGLVIVPGILIAFFAAHGALHAMFYCVIQHNALPGLGKWAKAGFHQWLFPISLPVLLGLGWLCMHSSADERIGAGRALILMTWGAFYFLLKSYWPLVTAQDTLPVLPLVALTTVPFLFHVLSLTGWPARVAIPVTSLVVMGCEIGMIWRQQSPLDNRMAGFERNLAIVLHVTDPGDPVMDGKGETIFRNRPTYWVLEGVTLRRIQLGLIPDDVKERMIATGTCVALNNRLRPADKAWLRANYLQGTGKIWVAGKNLGTADEKIAFHTDVRGRYAILSRGGKMTGLLDGVPLQDSQQIAAGDHQLETTGGKGAVALVWAQAVERGFNPFTRKFAGYADKEN